jgi:nucleotide-binding universal stress UspA family protein
MSVVDADRERSDLNTFVQDYERGSLATTGRLPNSGFRNAEYTSAEARATSAAPSHARSSIRRPPRNPPGPSSFEPQFAHAASEGAPVDALLKLADSAGVDLIVVGSVGFNSVVGRLIGSVPRAIRSRAKAEVLVVETK